MPIQFFLIALKIERQKQLPDDAWQLAATSFRIFGHRVVMPRIISHTLGWALFGKKKKPHE